MGVLRRRVLVIFGKRILGVLGRRVPCIFKMRIFSKRDQRSDGPLLSRLGKNHTVVFRTLLYISGVISLLTDGVTTYRGLQQWFVHGDFG